MTIEFVKTKEQLDALYNEGALTWEGLIADEENLEAAYTWLKDHHALIEGKEPLFHITKGKVMNENYGLTGTNAYPDDLTIVSVTNIEDFQIAFARFRVGARWFSDIVDNNAIREEAKNGTTQKN